MNIQNSTIALAWLPGSGKTWLWEWLCIPWYHFHDMDNHGLENEVVWYWKNGVAQLVRKIGDRVFLRKEADFLMTHYWLMREWKFFSLENMVFSTSWSIVKVPESIEYLRQRARIILIRSSVRDEDEIATVLQNITRRPDWASRIVWMNDWPNGEKAESKTLEEELWKRLELYRKYADYTFVHPYTEKKEDRVHALREFILSNGITTTSTLHSA